LGAGVSPYYTHSQNTNVRRLNVVKAHESNRTLETMFGGAYSGTYSVQIRHKTFGLIDTSLLTFNVGSEVTAFSPAVGSIYGGQLITITGTNWDTDPRNNPVSITFNGALGSSTCYVQTSAAAEITCRLQEFAVGQEKANNLEGKLIVFLKTSEEATCGATGSCKYTFSSTVPTVTTVEPEWNAASNSWTIKIKGTAFTGDASTSALTVGGVEQPPVAVLSSTAVF
jgi:hypothetical protein